MPVRRAGGPAPSAQMGVPGPFALRAEQHAATVHLGRALTCCRDGVDPLVGASGRRRVPASPRRAGPPGTDAVDPRPGRRSRRRGRRLRSGRSGVGDQHAALSANDASSASSDRKPSCTSHPATRGQPRPRTSGRSPCVTQRGPDALQQIEVAWFGLYCQYRGMIPRCSTRLGPAPRAPSGCGEAPRTLRHPMAIYVVLGRRKDSTPTRDPGVPDAGPAEPAGETGPCRPDAAAARGSCTSRVIRFPGGCRPPQGRVGESEAPASTRPGRAAYARPPHPSRPGRGGRRAPSPGARGTADLGGRAPASPMHGPAGRSEDAGQLVLEVSECGRQRVVDRYGAGHRAEPRRAVGGTRAASAGAAATGCRSLSRGDRSCPPRSSSWWPRPAAAAIVAARRVDVHGGAPRPGHGSGRDRRPADRRKSAGCTCSASRSCCGCCSGRCAPGADRCRSARAVAPAAVHRCSSP